MRVHVVECLHHAQSPRGLVSAFDERTPVARRSCATTGGAHICYEIVTLNCNVRESAPEPVALVIDSAERVWLFTSVPAFESVSTRHACGRAACPREGFWVTGAGGDGPHTVAFMVRALMEPLRVVVAPTGCHAQEALTLTLKRATA